MTTVTIQGNIPLKDRTTFNVGGLAKYYCEVKDTEELKKAVDFAMLKNIPIFVLGGGSDILLSDEGYNGLVIQYKYDKIKIHQKNKDYFVTAGAGMIWDDLVKECVERGLQGIECLSGIPGTVGAAPIQNIGAYGQELKDTFVELTAFDLNKNIFTKFNNKECNFSYRESVFKEKKNFGKYIITDITLKLKKDNTPTVIYSSLISYLESKKIIKPDIKQVRQAVLNIRAAKLEDPKSIANAGSFYKNPIISKSELNILKVKYPEIPSFPVGNNEFKLFAGWLIEKSGWKGKRFKNAAVSEKNAIVLVNPHRKATAKEIVELSDRITKDVFNKFTIKLEREVQFIGI